MWLTVTKQDTVQILRFELARVNSKAVQWRTLLADKFWSYMWLAY